MTMNIRILQILGIPIRAILSIPLVQGGVSKNISDQYYYEVLEKGILSIIDEDHGGAGCR